jgi:hypothetical protein
MWQVSVFSGQIFIFYYIFEVKLFSGAGNIIYQVAVKYRGGSLSSAGVNRKCADES